jgi:hypothetical protein
MSSIIAAARCAKRVRIGERIAELKLICAQPDNGALFFTVYPMDGMERRQIIA